MQMFVSGGEVERVEPTHTTHTTVTQEVVYSPIPAVCPRA
jgi:hypothetical protein